MLRSVIGDFYNNAAKAFSKLGNVQFVESESNKMTTISCDGSFVKKIMDSTKSDLFRYVRVDSLFPYTKDESQTLVKRNQRKILMDKNKATYIGDFYEDTFEKFGLGDSKIIDFNEESERLDAEAKAARSANAKDSNAPKGGIFNYEYFYDADMVKHTLNEILQKDSNKGKTILWAVENKADRSQVLFKQAAHMAEACGIQFDYVFIKTCECVWKHNSKKFPCNDSMFVDKYKEICEAYSNRVQSLKRYTDVSSWYFDKIFNKFNNKEKIFEVLDNKLGAKHPLTKYSKTLIESYLVIKNLPSKDQIEQVCLSETDEYKPLAQKYEMLGELSNIVSELCYDEEEISKKVRYIKMVDAYTQLQEKCNG